MGREYAHRRYGPNAHSMATTPTFLNSWYRRNEITRFDHGHIPSGFLNDLIDNNIYNRANNLQDNPTDLPDHIYDYKISTIFNNMGPNTTSAASLINGLRQNLPAGTLNTTINYDSLRAAYNY